ncbi:MAG: hypothetical protein MUE52_05885 [Tabrizicola sp.]|jgi:hypothetical protein|nr:hypothetical protein [Tabrizicola sp.]
MHESNILELAKSNGHIVIGTNSTLWIKKAQRLWLLAAGFGLTIAGGALQLVAAIWGT